MNTYRILAVDEMAHIQEGFYKILNPKNLGGTKSSRNERRSKILNPYYCPVSQRQKGIECV